MTPAERIRKALALLVEYQMTRNGALAALAEMEADAQEMFALLNRCGAILDKHTGEPHDEACARVVAERDALRLRVEQAEYAVEKGEKECDPLRAKVTSLEREKSQ